MSYQKRIDEMVGKHVAEFEMERALARQLKRKEGDTPMPYGYPTAVYHPMHICRLAKVKQFIAKTGGTLSNGVPRVLRGEQNEGYILGIYNPKRSKNGAC